MNRKRIVAVVGPGDDDASLAALAERVGELLARAGMVVATGGLGGVMESASRGARSAGGEVLGILPSDRAADANAHVGIAIPTGMGEARNVILVHAAEALVAVGRSPGTLSEAALAVRAGKRVASLHSHDLEDPGFRKVDDPEAAVAWALGQGG